MGAVATSLGLVDMLPSFRENSDGHRAVAARTSLKSCPEIRNPLDWLPRHGTPRHTDAADNFVRNLVNHKIVSFAGKYRPWRRERAKGSVRLDER